MNAVRVAAHSAPDGSLAINGGTPAVGREAIAETARGFFAAFQHAGSSTTRSYRDETGPGGTGYSVGVVGFEDWTMNDEGLIAASSGHYDPAEYAHQLKDGV